MGVNYYTEEQVAELEKNKYVKTVSIKAITYTEEFRELFYNEYINGKIPSQIFSEHGFDLKALGRSRIDNFTRRVKMMNVRGTGFEDTRSSNSGRPRTKDMSPEEKISYLEHKLAVKEQQIEALKKTNSINRRAYWKQNQKNSH